MKAVILAGGYGTRLSEETVIKPKPMVEIGGKPILWHIMKYYASFGVDEFIIALGYKGYYIKEYFANYFLHQSDVTIDLRNNSIDVHNNTSEPWKVTLIDTGIDSNTAFRIKQLEPYVDDTFFLTYGDGVSDVNLDALLDFHKKEGKIGTMTAIQPEGRFGILETDGNQVSQFVEKPKGDGNWINGGYFIFEKAFFDYLPNDPSVALEQAPLKELTADGQLNAYKHNGFWKCMDTLRDKQQLESLWATTPPWKRWK